MNSVDKKFDIDGDEFEEDLTHLVEVNPEACEFDDENPDNDIIEDYKFVRTKLRYAIAACETVLGRALTQLATDPAPRVVEGCSTIIKTITDSTSQLLDVHQKINKMRPVKEPDPITGELDSDGKTPSISAGINDLLSAFDDADSCDGDETLFNDE